MSIILYRRLIRDVKTPFDIQIKIDSLGKHSVSTWLETGNNSLVLRKNLPGSPTELPNDAPEKYVVSAGGVGTSLT